MNSATNVDVGTRQIGDEIVRLAVASGYDVVLNNCPQRASVSGRVAELGRDAGAGAPVGAARAPGVIVVTISPQRRKGATVDHFAGSVMIEASDGCPQRDGEVSLREESFALRREIDQSSMFEEIVGSSERLRTVLVQIAKVAKTDSTVLVLGETGTGKELMARAIHRQSNRSARPFIRVNCAAIPQSLIASELFGHEKGAFTGAVQRHIGRFESANGGTLFLDEIGDLPAETQIALLRVLQEREIERVGSHQPIAVDVRVIAATNRRLREAVAAGTLRQDLFYRLNVFPIEVPSLRERSQDIPVLVEYFIERCAKRTGKRIKLIGKKTMALFRAYDWPGNIRELQNVVERGVILCDSETFGIDEDWLRAESPSQPMPPGPLAALADHEREIIESALSKCRGRISGPAGAAAVLEIPRQTLESKIASLGINKRHFKVSSCGCRHSQSACTSDRERTAGDLDA